jgi:ABC-type dipeptide/oligopeptide/nickel transport system permease component
MRKIKRAKTVRKSARCAACKFARRPSFVLGVLADLWFALCAIAKVGAFPVRTIAHAIHRLMRKHPALRFKHAHVALCVLIGFTLVLVSFVLEKAFNHVLWTCTLETLRAAGVCPIWDAVSGISKVYEELT